MTNLPYSLTNLAQRFAAPEHLLPQARRARYGGQPPSAGQIWSATWDEYSALVLLLASADTRQATVTAVPLTTEPDTQDEAAVLLSSAATSWPIDLTAWLDLRTELPVRVLWEPVDEVTPDLLAYLQAGSGTLPDGVRPGRVSTGPFDPADTFRAELLDTVSALAAAPALPAGSDSDGDLRDLDLTWKDIRAALGTSQAEAMDILFGKKQLDTDQVALLVQAQPRLSAEQVLSRVRPLPPALAHEMDQPTWKPRIVAAARRSSRDESRTRRVIAYSTYATAARQDISDDWAGRLRRYFEAHEGDGR